MIGNGNVTNQAIWLLHTYQQNIYTKTGVVLTSYIVLRSSFYI